MAYDAYLQLKGQKQGDIKGSGTRPGRKDQIKVVAWSHDIVSPRDLASGLPTGKRQHKPFVITKEIDASSPLLMSMLVTNECIPQWTLTLWQRGSRGKDVAYFTIRLTNASIAEIRQEMLNNQYPENQPHREREQVSFTYKKIEWTHLDGGITAVDDWDERLV